MFKKDGFLLSKYSPYPLFPYSMLRYSRTKITRTNTYFFVEHWARGKGKKERQ